MNFTNLLRSLVHFESSAFAFQVRISQCVYRPTSICGSFTNFDQVRGMSRVKRRFTHPPYWHATKNLQKPSERVTEENEAFIKEIIEDKFSSASPIKGSEMIQESEWNSKTLRTGVIARNIGRYPLWTKDGSRVLCTLLQVLDNHVVRYIPPEEYAQTVLGKKRLKHKKPRGCLVVGAEATDPQKFSKQYCQLFSEAGLMPKKRLARFLITPNAALPPGVPLLAGHFRVGQYVDVYGKTIDYGFQGVVKRWGMKGGPASHGTTKAHRRVGSIGSGRDKARVWPGKKMPGHMGSERRYNRGLQILRINMKYNVIYVRGSVPGATNSIVHILDTILPLRKPTEAPPHPTYFLPKDGTQPTEDIYYETIHQFGTPSIQF